MKKSLGGLAIGILILLCTQTFAGCFFEHHDGSCDDDEDLRHPYNFYEGAICVDGHAECPDGKDFCYSQQTILGRSRIVSSCIGPCIECPKGRGACASWDDQLEDYIIVCVERESECWSQGTFLPIGAFKKACERAEPACL